MKFDISVEFSGTKIFRVEADSFREAVAISQYSLFPSDYNAYSDMTSEKITGILQITDLTKEISHG